MSEKEICISSNIKNYQMAFFVFSIFMVICFLIWAIVNGGINYFLIVLVTALFFSLANLFSARFFDVRIKNNVFFVNSFFKSPREIDLLLFDRITEMKTILFMPSAPYFTIFFKNGEMVHFVAKASENINFPFKDKNKIAKSMTDEIEKYLQLEERE